MNTDIDLKIIISAGNEKSALLYKKLLSSIDNDLIKRAIVFADDETKHIGSGGAFFKVLSDYFASGDRIILINCGGESKRSINYSVCGKAFATIITDAGEQKYLIELIVENALNIMKNAASGVLVCCSDILVDTACFSLKIENNVGFCVYSDIETGARHGVMFKNESGLLQDYLHKSSPAELSQIAERYAMDSILIDTGMVFFSSATVNKLIEAEKRGSIVNYLIEAEGRLNLYSDIIEALSIGNKAGEDKALICDEANVLCEKKQLLKEALLEDTLDVYGFDDCRFIHFGTMKEALDNIYLLSKEKINYINLKSKIDASTSVGEKTVCEYAALTGCHIGSGCLISDIILENVSVNDETTVCGIKLNDGSCVAIVCSIFENPKIFKNGQALWETPRFYKGSSFTDSYLKYLSASAEESFSLDYCIKNADYNFCFNHRKYLHDILEFTENQAYYDLRNRIIEHYRTIQKAPDFKNCEIKRATLELPVRINFSGTWTDAMPYCIENDGAVINMAVTVDGKLPIRVEGELTNSGIITFCSDGVYADYKPCIDDSDELSDFKLHYAVLKALELENITDSGKGLILSTNVIGLDKGSGLGISSILIGGCIRVIDSLLKIERTDTELIETIFVVEQIMGTGGGWQDQVGGLFPSIKIGSSVPRLSQQVSIEYIKLGQKMKECFSDRLVLIPTGQRHFGKFIVNDVANRYLSKNAISLLGFSEIYELNFELKKALENDDTKACFDCINRHFQCLKMISPLVSSSLIDKMRDECLTVCDAVSICGAGGGGYFAAILKEKISVNDMKAFIKRQYPLLTSDVLKAEIFGAGD